MMVICDTCSTHFVPELRASPSEAGEAQFFTCPACGHRHDVCQVSPEGLRLRQEVRKLAELLKRHESPKLRRKYEKTLARYRAEVNPTYHRPGL